MNNKSDQNCTNVISIKYSSSEKINKSAVYDLFSFLDDGKKELFSKM